MEHYNLRVDTHDDAFVNAVLFDSHRYIFCREEVDGGNPHMHFYIITKVKIQTLRKRVKSQGFAGNASYSLKTVKDNIDFEYDDEMYCLPAIAYVIKNHDFVNVRIPDAVIGAAREYDQSVKNDLKTKKKKKTIDALLEYVKREHQADLSAGENVGIHEIAMSVLRYHVENELMVRKFSIQAYVDTIFLRLYPSRVEGLWDLWHVPMTSRR